MKNILTFTLILMALTACTSFRVQTSESAATEILPNMPNPASVYCKENGNTLEIQTAADGSQSSMCIFPDGSTCEEWAYFRGECGPAAQKSPTPAIVVEATSTASAGATEENASGGYIPPGTSEEIAGWWGVIKSTPPGAQYDDYFERQDLVQTQETYLDRYGRPQGQFLPSRSNDLVWKCTRRTAVRRAEELDLL